MTDLTAPSDTIVAPATANGKAGVSVVRVSGPLALPIARALTATDLRPRYAAHVTFRDADGAALDSGLALYFPAPHSYTGEDVLEIQGHGSPVVVDTLIRRVGALGARLARPGEFSERAFLNDKMDLAQAEAVADLIDSGSRQAAKAAMRSLQGEFSTAVQTLTELVIELRMHVEAAIDFPEEEIDFLDDAALHARITRVTAAFDALQARVRTGRALNDGLQIVLAGEPNVGKSSLLNQLVGDAAAIVTDVAGTTRDLIRESLVMEGLPVTLIDTAGLRSSDDVIEREGMRRTRQAIASADHALIMVDATAPDMAEVASRLLAEIPDALDCTLVINKIDLADVPAGTGSLSIGARSLSYVQVSATHALGIELLKSRLLALAGFDGQAEGSFSARRRHVVLLEEARACFETGVRRLQVDKAGELMAEELRLCQQALGGITGMFTSDDLLGRIFSSFCIGK